MLIELTYIFYLGISIGITLWVARSLSSNGYVFLVDGFDGDEALAKSVNHLLVVGFYLINLGFVALTLRLGVKPENLVEAIEFLSTKVGLILVIVGIMHFINVKAISGHRERHLRRKRLDATAPLAGMS